MNETRYQETWGVDYGNEFREDLQGREVSIDVLACLICGRLLKSRRGFTQHYTRGHHLDAASAAAYLRNIGVID